MGQFIVRFDVDGEPRYLNWSTIVDAPTTYGMTLPELQEYVKERWGSEGLRGLPERITRADGPERSSALGQGYDWKSLVESNRAGKGECCLTEAEIIEWYCRRQEGPPDGVGHRHDYEKGENCEQAIARRDRK